MNRMKQAIMASALEGPRFPEPGVVERRFFFLRGFLGFDGHFPGFPILPALVQVLTAVTVAEALRGRSLEVAAVENAKFQLQIEPETEVSVRCQERPTADRPTLDVRVTVPAGMAASFRLTVADAGEVS